MPMLKTLIVIVLSSLATYLPAKYGAVSVSRVISVYDGDTFRADLYGLPDIVGKNIGIRINGVDTPEIKGKCLYEKQLAIKARDFVKSRLTKAKKIKLTNLKRGKYFRIVSDVYADDVNIGQALIANDLAYSYHGGKKESWCELAGK